MPKLAETSQSVSQSQSAMAGYLISCSGGSFLYSTKTPLNTSTWLDVSISQLGNGKKDRAQSLLEMSVEVNHRIGGILLEFCWRYSVGSSRPGSSQLPKSRFRFQPVAGLYIARDIHCSRYADNSEAETRPEGR